MLSQVSCAICGSAAVRHRALKECEENFCMISGFFLPIALRRLSASFSEKPARSTEASMTCSW